MPWTLYPTECSGYSSLYYKLYACPNRKTMKFAIEPCKCGIKFCNMLSWPQNSYYLIFFLGPLPPEFFITWSFFFFCLVVLPDFSHCPQVFFIIAQIFPQCTLFLSPRFFYTAPSFLVIFQYPQIFFKVFFKYHPGLFHSPFFVTQILLLSTGPRFFPLCCCNYNILPRIFFLSRQIFLNPIGKFS